MMKKIVLFLLLSAGLVTAQAQTAAETLEWLKAKAAEVDNSYIYSTTVDGGNRKIEITSDHIKVYSDNGASTTGTWHTIKEIKPFADAYGIKIILEGTYEGNQRYIRFDIRPSSIRDRYIKALKHMAVLKGARLIDENLF